VQAGFVQRGSLPFGASLRGLKARGNPEQEATPWIASLRSQWRTVLLNPAIPAPQSGCLPAVSGEPVEPRLSSI